VDGFDPDILDTIPDVFPHLTTLGLIVQGDSHQYFRWKVSIQLFFLCALQDEYLMPVCRILMTLPLPKTQICNISLYLPEVSYSAIAILVWLT